MQTKSQSKSKKPKTTESILLFLREAGPEGLTVKQVADLTGMKPVSVQVWFSTTGRRCGLVKKLRPGVYAAKTMDEAHLEHEERWAKQFAHRAAEEEWKKVKANGPNEFDHMICAAVQQVCNVTCETAEMFPELVTAAPDPKSAKHEMLSEIKALRKRGWTANALAERLRVPARTLQRWLLGKILPPCWVCSKLITELQEIGWENPPFKKTVSTSIN